MFLGSDAWINRMILSGKYSYHDCEKYERIMQAFVKREIKAGDSEGFPILKDGETIPFRDLYAANPMRTIFPNAIAPAKTMPFLRSGIAAKPHNTSSQWIYIITYCCVQVHFKQP